MTEERVRNLANSISKLSWLISAGFHLLPRVNFFLPAPSLDEGAIALVSRPDIGGVCLNNYRGFDSALPNTKPNNRRGFEINRVIDKTF